MLHLRCAQPLRLPLLRLRRRSLRRRRRPRWQQPSVHAGCCGRGRAARRSGRPGGPRREAGDGGEVLRERFQPILVGSEHQQHVGGKQRARRLGEHLDALASAARCGPDAEHVHSMVGANPVLDEALANPLWYPANREGSQGNPPRAQGLRHLAEELAELVEAIHAALHADPQRHSEPRRRHHRVVRADGEVQPLLLAMRHLDGDSIEVVPPTQLDAGQRPVPEAVRHIEAEDVDHGHGISTGTIRRDLLVQRQVNELVILQGALDALSARTELLPRSELLAERRHFTAPRKATISTIYTLPARASSPARQSSMPALFERRG
mmetsp:Transcript_6441/g.18436  ORF Transcript_6441/g.18436 Transcript_6441/m.18436 type:complete len:322 (-) Transcript_6441:8-973(-)